MAGIITRKFCQVFKDSYRFGNLSWLSLWLSDGVWWCLVVYSVRFRHVSVRLPESLSLIYIMAIESRFVQVNSIISKATLDLILKSRIGGFQPFP